MLQIFLTVLFSKRYAEFVTCTLKSMIDFNDEHTSEIHFKYACFLHRLKMAITGSLFLTAMGSMQLQCFVRYIIYIIMFPLKELIETTKSIYHYTFYALHDPHECMIVL